MSGIVDPSTELGARVYQLVKDGALSWSIGFSVPAGGRRQRRGVSELVEIDLAEISVTPTPAAEGTRTLSIKNAAAAERSADEQALAQKTLRESKRLAAETLEELGLAPRPKVEPVPGPQPVRPWTALVFDGCTFRELPPGSELATPEQIAAREERQARQARQVQLIEEAQRDRARQEPRTINVNGHEVTKVTVNGQVWFQG